MKVNGVQTVLLLDPVDFHCVYKISLNILKNKYFCHLLVSKCLTISSKNVCDSPHILLMTCHHSGVVAIPDHFMWSKCHQRSHERTGALFTETVGSPLSVFIAHSSDLLKKYGTGKIDRRDMCATEIWEPNPLCAKVNVFENVEIRVSVLERISLWLMLASVLHPVHPLLGGKTTWCIHRISSLAMWETLMVLWLFFIIIFCRQNRKIPNFMVISLCLVLHSSSQSKTPDTSFPNIMSHSQSDDSNLLIFLVQTTLLLYYIFQLKQIYYYYYCYYCY